jgi:hypothetical protein
MTRVTATTRWYHQHDQGPTALGLSRTPGAALAHRPATKGANPMFSQEVASTT